MGEWQRHFRRGGTTLEPESFITIRKEGIALNAHFVATANLREMPYANIYTDGELFRLGFQFFKESPDGGAYSVVNDGGGPSRKGRGRCIQAVSLIREHPWLKAVANISETKLRRFRPVRRGGMWEIAICPPFEHRVSDRSDIPSSARGIYRYKRGDDIVYIGKGQIRSRLGAFERADWDFETIEYSLVSDNAEQTKWEFFWLDHFKEEKGELPFYNRISGTKPKSE